MLERRGERPDLSLSQSQNTIIENGLLHTPIKPRGGRGGTRVPFVSHEADGLLINLIKITANIDVADGLANGAVGKLSHFEFDDQIRVLRVCLLFPNAVGVKAREKVAGYVNAIGICIERVLINRRSANKSIHAKRNNLSLKPGLTIHKSQEGTFDEIIYRFIKCHSQPLVYVALSSATAQEVLHIVPTDGCQRFYHGRRSNEVMLPLRNEFIRLSTVHLTTTDHIMTNKMNGGDMVLFSLNCQSLRAHAHDLPGNIVQKVHIF
ncbi:ATP-dependent DNA helicase [Trichonephila inaurata madagascariensis]|uniref:ATP-dependent DNA helicase n=1 Tax=Trichonephila inaurata madagascariensis TaxID=2747483 RepID=A0A8X6MAT7_9ARAC|nr:ATP-dependent DNA helicase [Trichonephila inaurata madagascariensis]